MKKEDYLKAKKIVDEYEREFNIKKILASDFLTYRKISLTNSVRAMINRKPETFKNAAYYALESSMQYGYDLAVRRLKNNKL